MIRGGVNLPTVSAPSGNTPQAIYGAFNQSQAASVAGNQQLFNWYQGNANPILAQQQQALNNAVQFLYGTNKANNRSIDRRFEAEGGQMTQNLIDHGLGNATIQESMHTGLTRAHADAISGSRAAFGGQLFNAAYQSALANSGLAQQQLSTLFQGTNIGYPDFGAFAHAAGMSGGQPGFGGFGGGGLTVGDMSRPVGGAQPAWAYYGGGGDFPGAPPGGSMGGAAPAWGPNTSALYPAGFAKDEWGAVPGSQTYGGGRGGMGYGAGSSMETASMAGLYAPQAEATGY